MGVSTAAGTSNPRPYAKAEARVAAIKAEKARSATDPSLAEFIEIEEDLFDSDSMLGSYG